MLQKVCGTMDHCFIMTHSMHKVGDILQIYFCVMFCKRRHHARAHVSSGALIHCALSLAVRRTQMAGGLMISLATLCYGDFCWGLQLFLLLILFFFSSSSSSSSSSPPPPSPPHSSSLSPPPPFPPPPTPQNSLLTLPAWAPVSVSSTRIPLLASSSSFIYFFPAIVR